MTILLDSNVYIYALDPSDEMRHEKAVEIVGWHLRKHAVIARQVIGEVFAVAHRKRQTSLDEVRLWSAKLLQTCLILPTDDTHLTDASFLAERHHMQFWDAVICTVGRRAGMTVLLSEDMHDGLRLGTMTVINPFATSNGVWIDDLLSE